MFVYKFIGALGLIFICLGILTKKRKQQDWFYIVGGICLEVYSLYLGDLIFMVLQVLFVLVAVYDLNHIPKIKKKSV